MQAGIKYLVIPPDSDQPIGYILDLNYYEPYSSNIPIGYITKKGEFIYNVAPPGNEPSISGRLESGKIIRDDGKQFTIIAQQK